MEPVLDTEERMKTIVVAGTCSGVGKSTIAAGLMAAYSRRGLRVQPFKIGPDFLDPLYHSAATGRQSYNLDTWMLSREANLMSFRRCVSNTDLAIVEGVMGLYDGYDGKSEYGSTAEMAKLLSASVVLVFDCWAFARTAAAMMRGYTTFDPQVKFAGVIFNKVRGPSHTTCLQEALSLSDTNIHIFGGIPKVGEIHVEQMHAQCDGNNSEAYVQQLADLVELHLDLDAVLELATTAGEPGGDIDASNILPLSQSSFPSRFSYKHARIGIARDAAFCFQYHENLSLLQDAGAEVVYFSPLRDPLPPSLDAIFFGGGYLGLHLDRLSANKQLLYAVRAFADAGGVVYGESGGLMYLSQGVEGVDMQLFPMSGVFPFWTRFREVSRTGYVKVMPRENCVIFPAEIGEIRGFMCSSSEIFFRDGSSIDTCCKGFVIKDDQGTEDLDWEGYMHRNSMSSLVHLHFGSNPGAAHAFVERCRMDRTKAAAVAAASASAVAGVGPEAAAAAGAAAAEAVTAVLGECRDIVPYHGFEMAIRRDYFPYQVGNTQIIFPLKQGDDSNSSETTSYSGTYGPTRMESSSSLRENGTLRRTESFDLHHLRRTTSMEAHGYKILRSESEIWDRQQVRAHQLSEGGNQEAEDFSLTRMKVTRWNCNGNGVHPGNPSSSYRSLGSGQQQQFPSKIMSLVPSVTEILVELGAGNRLVATMDCCDGPSGVQHGCHVVGQNRLDVASGSSRNVETTGWKPYLGSLTWRGNKLKLDPTWMEKVKPDLIVTQENIEESHDSNMLTTSAQAGVPSGKNFRIQVFNPCRVPEVFDSILDLGNAVGLYMEACLMVEHLRTRLRKVAVCVALQRCPRMLLLQGLNPFFLGGHWIPEVEALAGGYDGLQKPGCGMEMLHWQRIISYAPEVLVLSPCTLTIEQTLSEVELLARLHGFWSIPAVEAGRVYICEHACFSSPGPRMVNGVELLASILHPLVTNTLQLQETAWKLNLNYGQQCRIQDLRKHFKPCI